MGINNPSYFPKGDESWKQVFGLERKKCEAYPYTDTKGNILFVVYRAAWYHSRFCGVLRLKKQMLFVTRPSNT